MPDSFRKQGIVFLLTHYAMRLENLNNLPLNTITPNFAIFVVFGTASLFIEGICSSEIEAKREAILFFFGC